MKLSNINMLTPKKLLFTTLFATSLVAGASALNTPSEDIYEEQRIETVDNSLSDRFVSVIKNIDKYDSKVIDNISGTSNEPFTTKHKTSLRILAGLIISGIGGMVGALRKEKGKKHFAGPEQISNIGFAAGFMLPGVSSALILSTALGFLAGKAGTLLSKGNKLVGKISSGIVGLATALKFLFLG